MCILLVSFLFLCHFSLSLCDLISSSSIQRCLNSGTGLTCSHEMVVALTVINAQNNTESIQVDLSEVVDLDGVVQTLVSPYTITITKTPVYVRYPLTYFQSFNNKPTEQVMQLGPGFQGFFDPCEDRAGAGASSTCPPAYDYKNKEIVDSQGFCWFDDSFYMLRCSYCSLQQFLGIDPYSGTRGDLNCELFGSQVWY